MNKRKIEIFSAGCPACDQAIETVKRIACPSCEIEILDMHQPETATRAAEFGINRIPTIVVDGTLAGCGAAGPADAQVLRATGVGVPLAQRIDAFS